MKNDKPNPTEPVKQSILPICILIVAIVNVIFTLFLFFNMLGGHYPNYLQMDVIAILTALCLLGTINNN